MNRFIKKSKNTDKIPYCENPAIGIGAPECSEDCCNYGCCHKNAYFKYICEKQETLDSSYAIFIDDTKYSLEEIVEILKKHKEEEDKKYIECDRCGVKYLENIQWNMAREQLGEEVKPGQAIMYQSTPYINGIQIQSTCGAGKKLKLCDNCISKLISWLKHYDY